MSTWPTVQELLARTELDSSSGCRIWQGATCSGGYGMVSRSIEGEPQQQRTHRLMWQAAYGPIPRGLLVMHLCDRPACITPEHLSLGTKESNAAQAKHRGRTVHLYGEASGKARLTDAEVAEIRRRFDNGENHPRELAEMFGVSQSYVKSLVYRVRRTKPTGWKDPAVRKEGSTK